MARIIIEPEDIKANSDSTASLLHDATNLVTFSEGMSNPLTADQCFALYFFEFDIGVCIQHVGCSTDKTFRRARMFTLGKLELSRFNVPAEFMCPASVREDWKSPLTKHITLKYLSPAIRVSPSVVGDRRSIRVTLNINNHEPGSSIISTNTASLELIR